MRNLKNKVVLITGGSRGIGAEIARGFGAQGARVAITARSEDELEKTRVGLEAAAVDAIAIACDVSRREALQRLVAEVTRSMGPIDVLVNNAAAGELIMHFADIDPDDIERTFRVNVLAVAWLTQLVLPTMIERGSGHIVNISSNAGIIGVPYNAVYSSTKHALMGLSRSLRGELDGTGVGVSVICPTFVYGGRIDHNFDGEKPPKAAGNVTEAMVAKQVVDAVVNDRAEVIVNKGLGKISDVAQALAPDLTLKMAKRMGVVDMFRKAAERNRDRVRD